MATSIDPRFNQVLSTLRSGDTRALMADGSVRFLLDPVQIPASIRQTYPGGVDTIVIAESPRTGWSPADTYTSNGIIAILIGLLLPAVQAAREAARRSSTNSSPDPYGLLALKTLLRPGGKIFVTGADGRMLPFMA
jgi:hypothetical protein